MMSNHSSWTTKSFSECVDKIIDHRGKTPKKLGLEWGNGNILALSANNVKKGKIDTSIEAYYGSDELYDKWMTNGKVNKGDVIMTMEAPLGNVTQIPDTKKYILSQRVAAFKTIEDIDDDYFKYYLSSSKFQNLLDRFSTGTTAKGISQKNLRPLPVSYPSIKEQQKIACILSSVDEAIEKTEGIVKQIKIVKRGITHELFSRGIGNTEYKDSDVGRIPKSWKVVDMDTVFDTIDGDRGKNYPNTNDFIDEGYCLFLDTKNVTKSGFIFDTKKFISKEKDKVLRNGKLSRNDFVMTSRGSIGNIAFYGENIPYENIRINSAMLILRAYDKELNFDFWMHLLRGRVIEKYIRKFKVGSAQPHITKKSFQQLKVSIPSSSKEQQEIANILNEIDNKIRNENDNLLYLKSLKRGLMKQLLTGKVRVPITENEEVPQ
ncbi:restriction endonuclease subunit S [Salinicoccus sp. HZC-1]|uniref:restriction endonuclease subunit S n=1 Tax=Salinicoccus sp. HZC-1 TaxID=3385497 RepID=UPI00398B884D